MEWVRNNNSFIEKSTEMPSAQRSDSFFKITKSVWIPFLPLEDDIRDNNFVLAIIYYDLFL
jgi:hypothetical protein